MSRFWADHAEDLTDPEYRAAVVDALREVGRTPSSALCLLLGLTDDEIAELGGLGDDTEETT